MSDYAGYQKKRAHALGPFASVYEATAPDGTGRYALKIFHPPASTRIRRAYEVEGFLLAAERQQKAYKKDGAVLEVVAFGRCPEGAFVVTPWQDRSLEPFLTTLAARGDLLRAVAELLLTALERWGAQTGGSHRKLKAANVFLTKSGPLEANSALLSDAWFQLGTRTDTRRHDLAAVGAILAEIVRRREIGAWPIEDAPEWKALGRAGKAWLAYVNYLMDPQPATGEVTIAEARKRLKAIPKDANPAKTAAIIGVAAMVLLAGGVVGFARFGNPTYMPRPVLELAVKVKNPRAYREEVTEKWPLLCRAWDTWLGDLQSSARRLNSTADLWAPNDPLKAQITAFLAEAEQLRPEKLVPEAAGKSLGTLANATPDNVREELRKITVYPAVDAAYDRVMGFAVQFERWQRWEELRALLQLLEARNFNRGAGALRAKLPAPPGGTGYKLDTAIVTTFRLFKELSLDTTGTLLLASRWNAITKLKTDMEGTAGDRVQNAMPKLILEQLRDTGSIGNFAESLGAPLDELKQRRERFLDPQVVRERFLADSPLLKETAEVTVADFARWEEQLALYSKVPTGDDPRVAPALDASANQMQASADDLEADAPEGEAGNVATLSRADFDRELASRRTELQALRAKPIVRADLPAITDETKQMAERLSLLEQRVAYTVTLLNPQTWLDKVRQPFGNFNETRQRWAAWQATAVGPAVTADSLRGAANRPKFRDLRAQERQVKAWINGLEGAEGLAALTVPDLSGATPDTADVLRQLEAARREQTATQAAAAVEWRNGLPQTTWAAASATVRAPLDAHRQWLVELPAFATDLDQLAKLLAGGFGWTEGVSAVADRLAARPGVDALTAKPAESVAEARLLGQLVASNDRPALVAAAQSGKLSRMLTAWRRLGAIAGWPANAADLDVDGGVVESLRSLVPATVTDETRRGGLLDELGRETRVRWNRAARNSASDIAQMSAVFERMEKYKISEEDLETPARINLNLWQLKRADWSEVEIAPLRQRRDDFVRKLRAIPGAMDFAPVKTMVDALSEIVLTVDPNRARTPSPRVLGWKEELTDAGLGLTAVWQRGGKTVKLDFIVVQPQDDLPPFYLAKRALSVGEFIDLMSTAPRETVDEVSTKLPTWAVKNTFQPFNYVVAWRPRVSVTGEYQGFELNPVWFNNPTALVNGLKDNADDQAKHPGLAQAFKETPTVRSPLQQVSPEAALTFAQKFLGARLPTPREWQEVLRVAGKPSAANYRGPNFQDLFEFLRTYNREQQTIPWRPNEGIYRPRVTVDGRRTLYVDDGRASDDRDESRLWFSSVDEGPATGGFINLMGNISIFLQDGSGTFYVAGGSALSPPTLDFTQPQKVEGSGMIGAKLGTEAYADVGIRPAFDAPPGFKERYKFLELVRKQGFLTW